MLQFAHIVGSEKVQILHCQDINCVIFSLIAKLLHPSLHILDTVHDTRMFTEHNSIKILGENLLCRKIIAISNAVKNDILSRHISSSKVAVIYNAIDISKFAPVVRKKPDKEHIHLGNVARILPSKKGQICLLQAMLLLLEKYPNLHCSFAGESSPKHVNEYQQFLDFIHTNNLEDHVTLCGNVSDIPTFLQSIDLFVLPSLYEGFGISLVEAMSTGLPCIASNIDGPAEIILNSNLGLLFEAGDSRDLANQIDYAITHYDTFDQSRISVYISQKFSIITMVDSLLKLYATL